MLDNIAGGIGRLPNEATRKRMVELVDSWPQAGAWAAEKAAVISTVSAFVVQPLPPRARRPAEAAQLDVVAPISPFLRCW
jgi:hypothetical protein